MKRNPFRMSKKIQDKSPSLKEGIFTKDRYSYEDAISRARQIIMDNEEKQLTSRDINTYTNVTSNASVDSEGVKVYYNQMQNDNLNLDRLKSIIHYNFSREITKNEKEYNTNEDEEGELDDEQPIKETKDEEALRALWTQPTGFSNTSIRLVDSIVYNASKRKKSNNYNSNIIKNSNYEDFVRSIEDMKEEDNFVCNFVKEDEESDKIEW